MRKEAIWNAVHEVGIHTRAVEGLIESALVELAELQSKLVQVSSVAGVSYSTLQESFEGVSATINDLVAGHVKIAILGPPSLLPHYRAGTLRFLAQSTATRSLSLPEVPTFQEEFHPNAG